jgi:hypothetical protein
LAVFTIAYLAIIVLSLLIMAYVTRDYEEHLHDSMEDEE